MSHKLLRLPTVKAESGLSRSTIYLRVAQGLWTRPVSLGARAVAWPADEVQALKTGRFGRVHADFGRGCKRRGLQGSRPAHDRIARVDRHFGDAREPRLASAGKRQLRLDRGGHGAAIRGATRLGSHFGRTQIVEASDAEQVAGATNLEIV